MTEWWRDSYERRVFERHRVMSMLRITVYGSFWPPAQKTSLEEICAFLRDQGFSDTDVVEGNRRPNEWGYDSYKLSTFYIEESDANFLFFTKGGARIGVTTECSHALNSPIMCKRFDTCVIFNQKTNGRDSIGDLDKARLAELNNLRNRIPVVNFETWDQAKVSAYMHAEDVFKSQGPILRARARS